jgi:lysozyme
VAKAKSKKTSTKKSSSRIPQWVKISVILLLLLTTAALAFNNQKYIRRAIRYISHRYIKTAVKPTDFPLGYDIHGIDVSHYQTDVDWDKLKAVNQIGDTIQFRFAFIKATEGLITEDRLFDEYWEDAKDHKIIRGAYHYFLPNRSALLQARNFISSVKLEKGDLPPVVDVEDRRGVSKQQLVKSLKIFLQEVKWHYKATPIIYSNMNFIEDYLAEDFKEYPFWIAHYYHKDITPIDSIQLLFWQHSDKADLMGVNGKTDANIFSGTEAEFKRLLIK